MICFRKELAAKIYSSSSVQPSPVFFSRIRWYLGPAAEARLQAVCYGT